MSSEKAVYRFCMKIKDNNQERRVIVSIKYVLQVLSKVIMLVITAITAWSGTREYAHHASIVEDDEPQLIYACYRT